MAKGFSIISPGSGKIYAERTYRNDQQIDQALQAAHIAQKKWKETPLSERAAICTKAVDYFVDHADTWGEEITQMMGRPIRYTPSEIKGGFAERARYMIEIAEAALADQVTSEKQGFQRFIRQEPIGTVLVLAPWNYPYLTSVNAIIPAIMAGNSIILKMAEQTALCAEQYAEAFDAAGLPKGVFQYLHIDHDQVANMIKAPLVDYVAFTGSVEGGRAVQQAISGRFISAGLELGGKDPAYVRADANLSEAVENLVDGAFFNSGQSCCGVERIYIHESVYDQFVKEFVSLTKTYQIGNPLDPASMLGPMVRVANAERAQQQVQSAIAQGAKLLVGSGDFPELQLPYLAPHVLVDVDHNMDLMKEETFGPVIGITSVKDDEEAIQFMNDSRYGLTASIWTADVEKAITIGDQIETGTWFMNRCDYLDPELAWTGVKDSGRGCTLSPLGYHHLTRPKSFHLKLPQ
ncbi:MAG: aldehyde dehydrogenase family protein [Cyclobacteriaceae bacterium]